MALLGAVQEIYKINPESELSITKTPVPITIRPRATFASQNTFSGHRDTLLTSVDF